MEGKISTLYLRITSLQFMSSAHFPSLTNQRQAKNNSGTYIYQFNDLIFSMQKNTLIYQLEIGYIIISENFSCYLSYNNPAFPLSLSFPIHNLNFLLDSICLCSQWYLPIHFISDYFNQPTIHFRDKHFTQQTFLSSYSGDSSVKTIEQAPVLIVTHSFYPYIYDQSLIQFSYVTLPLSLNRHSFLQQMQRLHPEQSNHHIIIHFYLHTLNSTLFTEQTVVQLEECQTWL